MMTNPTLERAARAVCELHGGDYWDKAAPYERGRYRDVARAVLMAVRSDEKIANMAYDAESVAHCDWGKIWERQIDAILNDGEGE